MCHGDHCPFLPLHLQRHRPAHLHQRHAPRKDLHRRAGASGIHLAWLLRRRGFNNTVIFEQRDRIGGYVWTDNAHPQDNITRELGAAFLSPDYDEVRGLLKRFNLSEVPISVSKGMDFHHNGTTTSASTWYSSWVYNISGIREPTLQQDAIQAALSKYNALHVSMFGNYTGNKHCTTTPGTTDHDRAMFPD